MKITEVKAIPLSIPLKDMPRRGVGQPVKKDAVVVRVTLEDGTRGYGQAHDALSPTLVAALVEQNLAPLARGHEVMAVEDLWQLIYEKQAQIHGPGASLYAALSGLDMAVWDARGKSLGVPVYQLLGGSRKKIRAYVGGTSFGFKPVEAIVEEAQRYAALGYTAMKLRLGESVAKDVARVQAVRRALGSDIDIMADVNTRYTILDLQRALPALEECGLFWLEEPFPPDAVADYAHFNGKASIPIAGGENHYLRFQARQLLETGAVSIIQPDPCKCGGITESKKIADMASAYRRFYAPHISSTMIDGAACVHLLCATPNGLIYEADLSPINPFRDELVAQGPRVVDGYIDPGDAPGLGITIDETLFDKYPGIAGPGTV
ncbi:MAG: mandelate racemase/muconate lactonizing enzyme family protein [Bryobacteraceae bacterium]|nr:mandelate racemase/muconate lactonizing enzyme family protein [Bryobacteraceae bacterium]